MAFGLLATALSLQAATTVDTSDAPDAPDAPVAPVAPVALSGQAYWQQEVNYVIDVSLDSNLRTISGTIDIQYINNAPDSLPQLYLKAFPNAVRRGSYADTKRRRQNNWSLADRDSSQFGSLTLIERDDRPRLWRELVVDNTIITVVLHRAVQPGDTLELSFRFITVLPAPHDLRMGYFQHTTKAAYWYPQVCVYDRVMGWVNSQYLDWGECYGDFGRFDVTIAAPDDQIIAATGVNINENETLPDSLFRLLHLSNYLKPQRDWPVLPHRAGKTKTWRFLADRVNDFAFTTSNQFCIDTGSVNGVRVVSYPLRSKAASWKDGVRLGIEAISYFSDRIYPYQWPVIRIADCFSGMEFPMLANCGSGAPEPGWWIVIYHEIGHQWFMGQVGSNQVDRPFLDEGFTTHIEHLAIEQYLGREGNNTLFRNWYQRAFAPSDEDRDGRGFRPLLLAMEEGLDQPMLFSYDQGEEYLPYRYSAYYKSAAMHYALRSILSDSVYLRAMGDYCRRWFFRHPYEQDFVTSLEQSTGLQLDPYFTQWFHGRQRLDYAYAGRSTRKESGRIVSHTIRLKNKGRSVSPVEVAVIWEQQDTSHFTIPPEGMSFDRPDRTVLPTWHQFRRFDPDYSFSIKSQRAIRKVVVDPDNLLLDVDRMNNGSDRWGPIELRLDNLLYDRTPVWAYALRVRPDLWFDFPSGLQLGVHAHGSYLESRRRFSLDSRVGVRDGQEFVDFRFGGPLKLFGPQSEGSWRFLAADQRWFINNRYEKRWKNNLGRPDFELFRLDLSYLGSEGDDTTLLEPSDHQPFVRTIPYAQSWNRTDAISMALLGGMSRSFRSGTFSLWTSDHITGFEQGDESGSFWESGWYAAASLRNRHRTWLHVRAGFQSLDGQILPQYRPDISRGRPVDAFTDLALFRSPLTNNYRQRLHHFYPSTGFVRGYEERGITFEKALAGSLQVTLPDLLPYRWLRVVPLVGRWLGSADQSVFVDAAGIANGDDDLTLIAAAGGSVNFPPIWKGQGIRLDFPILLSRPAAGEERVAVRYGIAWVVPGLF